MLQTERGKNPSPEVAAGEPLAERSGRLAELTYLIAHELRNPCTIIGGFASLLNRVMDPADKESEYARIIVQESARMERAIDAVLDFSRSLVSDQELRSMVELAEAAVATFRSRHPQSSVKVTCPANDEQLMTRAGGDQMVSALAEILEQLWKRSREQADLEIEIDKKSTSGRIYMKVELPETALESPRTLIANLLASERDPNSLPLILARESLRLSGCELEWGAAKSGETYLYVDLPLCEEPNG
jgi:signal transduction histidine kinase